MPLPQQSWWETCFSRYAISRPSSLNHACFRPCSLKINRDTKAQGNKNTFLLIPWPGILSHSWAWKIETHGWKAKNELPFSCHGFFCSGRKLMTPRAWKPSTSLGQGVNSTYKTWNQEEAKGSPRAYIQGNDGRKQLVVQATQPQSLHYICPTNVTAILKKSIFWKRKTWQKRGALELGEKLVKKYVAKWWL